MRRTCRILPIPAACLVLVLSVAADTPPQYPTEFLGAGIPQMPGSRVVEVRVKDKVPVTVVLESEDTNSGVHVVTFYTLAARPFRAAWDYDHELVAHYESMGDLDKAVGTVNLLFENRESKKLLLIKDSRKGSSGSRIEITYPWRPLTFLERLEKAGVAKKP